ncbi:MAG: OmpA family protein [Pyrinomonadaceae bacterium]
MIEPRSQGVLDEALQTELPADDESMAELRSLLLGPAEARLAEIHSRVTDPQWQLKEVSHVLPAAIAVRSRQDNDLSEALAPTLTSAIERSVRKNPQPLVDAIFPVMGPAIRKAIAAALNGMVQSLNQSLSHSLSLQGLKWRFEAWRTGKSFAEVVLLHTLLYRVEQVFLIHKETGLLLLHVVAPNATAQDADMVSGMLTAIQDFVHDSFSAQEGDQLDQLQVGELTVWIERGPHAVLAGVIRGAAPQELKEVFQATIENIHLQYNEALVDFSGDAAQFEPAKLMLEDCLQAQFETRREAAGGGRKYTPLLIITGVILLALLLWGFFVFRNARRWNVFVEKLKSEPGIIVVEAGELQGKYFISGLRDPLARDPQLMLQEADIDPRETISRWQPFQAMNPEFLLARARQLLDAPATVQLKVLDNMLVAEGFATHQWVSETRRTVRFIPGLNQFRDDNLLDLDRIEKPTLLFELNQTQLIPGQEEKLQQLVADIKRLHELAHSMNKNVRLEITGHTDTSGTEARNGTLSQGRAETVASALNARLPFDAPLKIAYFGSKEKLRQEVTEIDRAANRSVTFKITFSDLQ